ncbi:MAG: transcription initiation factor IIB [Candidatus Helarchaeota archaeon]
MTYDKVLELPVCSTFEICCDNQEIIEFNGNYVCQNCGLVHGPVYLMSEKRVFTASDIEMKKQNEPAMRVGARTIIMNKNFNLKNGESLGVKERIKFAKLSKINNSYSTTYERNLIIATPRLKNFCEKLGIPPSVMEASLYYYSKAVKKKLTMGKSIETLICACIYLAVRLKKLPRSLEEISSVCESTTKSVRRTYRMLLKNLEIPNMKPVDYKQYILKYSSELNVKIEIQRRAMELIINAEADPDIRLLGKDPKGFAAAALYIACKELNEPRSQAVLSKIAHISEVTLRYRIRNLKKENL